MLACKGVGTVAAGVAMAAPLFDLIIVFGCFSAISAVAVPSFGRATEYFCMHTHGMVQYKDIRWGSLCPTPYLRSEPK